MDNKKNKWVVPILVLIIAVLSLVLVVVTISYKKKLDAATNVASSEKIEEVNQSSEVTEEAAKEETEEEEEVVTETTNQELPLMTGYKSLLSDSVTLKKPDVKANTKPYSVEPGLANIYNKELYYFDERQEKLLQDNLFYVVKPYGGYEFFEVYETNRYQFESSFVTVDSLMHTYHLFFAHLLRNIEITKLVDTVGDMSEKLLENANEQYDALKGSEWEEAAKRNVEFFAIGTALSGRNVNAAFDVSDVVEAELLKINNAEEIDTCEITGEVEDYTQYKPRGYYDSDDRLKAYFKTMMWYGRIQFNTKSEDMIRSSVLMNLSIANSGQEEWKNVYDVTTFFVGKADDLSFYDYYPLIQSIYGADVSVDSLAENKDGFTSFVKEVRELRLPEINSIPIYMGENNVIQGFRLMGQRFTIDAAVMQNLIYSRTDANSNSELRMLPDVLDVAAALGSDVAYDLLEEQGDMDYKNYQNNLDQMKESLSSDSSSEALGTNLYGNWLKTLRPLLTKKGEGYPSFMQSDAWAKKDLETFAGSYTELKHDTVLYAKQVMAEMGGGDIPELDDRGYVQPEPEVYARFEYLADATRIGLEDRGMISEDDSENLKRLAELASSLGTISEKELVDEVLTDEEYDLIREYGGTLEHFWYDTMKADNPDDDSINTEKYQAALCVDIATDPNGQVLEVATGQPCDIYVVVNVDGKVKIAKGSVYNFYQFAWPMSDRLTDSKWRQMMSFEPGDDGFFGGEDEEDKQIKPTWWTKDYSYVYEW